jgi:hypothetical protein
VNQHRIDQVFAAHRDSLMAIPGVVGMAIVPCGNARCIRVMVAHKTPELERRLPKEIEGYAVDVRETGPIRIRES